MKRLLFKETDLSTLPTPPAGYVYLGVSSTGEVSTVNTGGTVSSVSGSGSSGGAGLEGSQYVFVSANGTDTENASELQAAYDLAKTKKQVNDVWVNIGTGYYDVSSGSLFSFFDNPTTISWVSGQTYTIKLDGVEYTGVVNFGSSYDVYMSSVTAPDGSYSTMEVLSQEIYPSRVIVAPGYYNFSSNFLVDEDYVDIVSLDGNRSVIFNGNGTINVTADNIFLKGIDVQDKNFTIATNLGGLIVENCKGGNYSFGGDETSGSNPITVSGTFIDCEGGQYSFGAYGISSGYFENCIVDSYSFGFMGSASGTFIKCKSKEFSNTIYGHSGIASGLFNNCEGYTGAFGVSGTASGTFINCTSDGGTSFGALGTANGRFYNCVTSGNSFGQSGIASGTFINCINKSLTSGSFGGGFGGNASGTFINCNSGEESFGGGFGGDLIASGTFTNCIAGIKSFGGGSGVGITSRTASGVFTNCVSGSNSFGSPGGTLSGKLYYCRLTSGTFETVSGSGRTYYCVDGSGNTNNQ